MSTKTATALTCKKCVSSFSVFSVSKPTLNICQLLHAAFAYFKLFSFFRVAEARFDPSTSKPFDHGANILPPNHTNGQLQTPLLI